MRQINKLLNGLLDGFLTKEHGCGSLKKSFKTIREIEGKKEVIKKEAPPIR